MDATFDLPDSTDWLSTLLPAFEPLEAALRCEVCKEFLSNPVITSCSHTFCSICIRRCIATDGKCPTCKTGCSSDKLAPNIAVREVVMRFTEARPKALELARADTRDAQDSEKGKKRKIDETEIEDDESVRNTRSRQTRSSKSKPHAVDNEAPIEVPDSEGDDADFVPEGMAKCPICNKSMKAEQVYNHLDVCTGPDSSQGRSTRSKNKSAFPTALQRRQKEPSPPPARLSQLNYAMLKETALRKKLQELGIPNWGSKELMKRRHVEWLNIYNSNCDADDSVRKTKTQLLKELREWEETQGGRANNKESKIMNKDFDGNGYMKSHKTDFDELIARARQKRSTPKTEAGAPVESREGSVQANVQANISSDQNHERTTEPNGTNISVQESPWHEVMNGDQPPLRDRVQSYENNESAPSTTRAQVPASSDASPLPLPNREALLESTRRNSIVSEGIHNPRGVSSRKVPMFQVPSSPVNDVDGSGAQ